MPTQVKATIELSRDVYPLRYKQRGAALPRRLPPPIPPPLAGEWYPGFSLCFAPPSCRTPLPCALHFTRKSNPANLALLGVTISSIGKCLLNKAIFEYACESARAKRDRAALARRHRRRSTKPIADMIMSVRSLHSTVKLKAALSLKHSKMMTMMMISPVEEEGPGEHSPPHYADSAGVAGVPPSPLPDAAPDNEPRGETESKGETASPCPSTHRADAKPSGGEGVASNGNDETSWRRSSMGVPGLLGVGRRMSSALCLLDPLSQRGDETRSNAETTPPRPTVRTRPGTNECKSVTSED